MQSTLGKYLLHAPIMIITILLGQHENGTLDAGLDPSCEKFGAVALFERSSQSGERARRGGSLLRLSLPREERHDEAGHGLGREPLRQEVQPRPQEGLQRRRHRGRRSHRVRLGQLRAVLGNQFN